MSAHTSAAVGERVWWARAVLVLLQPVAVFEELRDDSREAAEARQEPVLAIVVLAGIPGVLSPRHARPVLAYSVVPLALSLPVWAAALSAGRGTAFDIVRALIVGWCAALLFV